MRIESHKLLPQVRYHVLFLNKHLVQRVDVLLDIAATLINIGDQIHLVLLNVDDLVYVLFMALD